ncbi:MAG: hypothetical protein MUF64_01760 [Polyangiaceae bacterium]|nr:hypothetical protein [Polyangiaceae bacterium]
MSPRTLAWLLPGLLGLLACGEPAQGESTGGSAGQGGAGQGGIAGAAGVTAGGQAGAPLDPCALWSAPEGDDLDERLPDLPIHLPGGPGSLHALRGACEQPQLLVLRVEPAWCAPCGARADQIEGLLAPLAGPHLRIETLLYAGPDNAPTSEADLLRWRQAHPSLPGGLLRPDGGDPERLVRGHGTLPLLYLVDARTMRISNVLTAPYERFLQEQVAASIAEVGGPELPLPPDQDTPLQDGRFDPFTWSLVQQMAAPWEPPPDPSNAHADNPAAAQLGALLFVDKSLAGSSGVACSTCHLPDRGFADDLPVSKGVNPGKIHTPTAMASLQRWFFWDGRADSLWAQALGPLENPDEMAGTRLEVAHRVKATYAATYESIFGPLPPLQEPGRFPAAGKPGDSAYEAMSPEDQQAVTRVFVNVGKAIAAYERTLKPAPTRLEAYAAGQLDALDPVEKDGLVAFFHSGCINCHHGPALSDGAFHNVLMPSHQGEGDRGRIDGLVAWQSSPFRKDGPFSDAPGQGVEAPAPAPGMLGQMKTPTLRGVARTGPWGHGGTFLTLDAVVKHYGQVLVQKEKPPGVVGERDAALGGFLGAHNKEMLAFLRVLGGE